VTKHMVGAKGATSVQASTIRVSAGSGRGRTNMAAFDSALRSAGVADHNLVRLSSIIPAGAPVQVCSPTEQLRGAFGDVLYCVYAVAYATERGDEAVAGIGWSLATDGSGRGLFVEHVGHAVDHVSSMIQMTLSDMSNGRQQEFTYRDQLLSYAHCADEPACAVVVATYRTAGWDTV